MRGSLPVYLITPDNEKIYKPHYQGFGVFGGFDAYALLAKWNVPEKCNNNIEHDRLISIMLEIKHDPAKFPLKFAKNPECSYDDLLPAQDDPAQGYFCQLHLPIEVGACKPACRLTGKKGN